MVSQLDFAEAWAGIQRAGYWFGAVVGLWALLYIINTATWWIIIRSSGPAGGGEAGSINPAWLYKITVSGFSLNYATPGGLMGGEPYRIMSLTPYIGAERASSSVILYVMTHIFSHFWFWTLSIVLFLLTRPLADVAPAIWMILGASAVFCALGLWFFIVGYRKGLAVRLLGVLRHIPFVSGWATRFVQNNSESLDRIDSQIAALHNQNPRTFVSAVSLELLCRVLSALEIYFCLLVIAPENASYADCILMLAFTSLVANLLFFIPLQLGGREGGFMLSGAGLAMSGSTGIFIALIVRLRELIWTAIGLLLIKVKAGSSN